MNGRSDDDDVGGGISNSEELKERDTLLPKISV